MEVETSFRHGAIIFGIEEDNARIILLAAARNGKPVIWSGNEVRLRVQTAHKETIQRSDELTQLSSVIVDIVDGKLSGY